MTLGLSGRPNARRKRKDPNARMTLGPSGRPNATYPAKAQVCFPDDCGAELELPAFELEELVPLGATWDAESDGETEPEATC